MGYEQILEGLFKEYNQNHDSKGEFSSGDDARFSGKSADGKVEGDMDVKVINPHHNAAAVTHTDKKGREYEGAFTHIRQVEVERPAYKDRPAKRFVAYKHQLSRR